MIYKCFYVYYLLMVIKEVFINCEKNKNLMKIIDRFSEGLKYALTGSNSRIKDLESELERSIETANVDYKTGLYNQRGFDDLVNRELRRGLRDNGRIKVQMIYFDLDNFKKVNDVYGHKIGDRTLRGFSKILLRSCRTEDIVARIGGDEFVYFAAHHDESDYNDLIPKLIPLVRQYNLINGLKGGVELDFSYGIFAQNFRLGDLGKNRAKIDETLNALNRIWLNIADQNMYEMKRRKKIHIVEPKSAKA